MSNPAAPAKGKLPAPEAAGARGAADSTAAAAKGAKDAKDSKDLKNAEDAEDADDGADPHAAAEKTLAKRAPSAAGSHLKAIFAAPFSRDRPTRQMGWFFLLSLSALFCVLVFGVKRAHVIRVYFAQRSARQAKEAQSKEELARKQLAVAHQKAVVISAGTFILELAVNPNQPKVVGVKNLAEMEIVLQCDAKETQEFLEKNIPRVRNEIVASFFALDRDQLLSKNGKLVLRRQIMDRLNKWLPEGKVVDLFFARLLIT